jgi:hypothetical protein
MIASELRIVAMAVVVGVVVFASHAPAGLAAGDDSVLVMHATTVTAPAEQWTITLLRWPSEGERAPLMAALTASPARQGGPGGTPPGAAAAAGVRGNPGGPAAAGGRANAAPTDAPNAAPAAGRGNTGAPANAAGGRGARGGARGGQGGAASTPLARLTAAIKAAPTLGFIWGSGVTGYSIKYAWRSPGSGSPARIVLVTDRRLHLRPLSASAPTGPAVPPSPDADNDFTLLEIRFDATGKGEGRTSLTSTVVLDQPAGTLALERDATIPVLLRISP